jgi:uncharacterized protein (TIGR02118 family)
MIKLTFALIRLPALTREAFQAYWLDHHGPLVKSVADVLRIRRYVQTHSLPAEISTGLRSSRGGPADYDGVAELWWDSIDDALPANPSQAKIDAGRLLLEDERKFIDLSRSPLWWGEERVIV